MELLNLGRKSHLDFESLVIGNLNMDISMLGMQKKDEEEDNTKIGLGVPRKQD